jgi:hypothetical protein
MRFTQIVPVVPFLLPARSPRLAAAWLDRVSTDYEAIISRNAFRLLFGGNPR